MELTLNHAKTADGVSIAYRAYGRGEPLVMMPNLPVSHLVFNDEMPERQLFARQLASKTTLVQYDSRGTGLSTRDVDVFSLEAYTEDLGSVVDDLELDRFALCAAYYAAPVALHYTAAHPERVSRLVLFHGFDRTLDFWQANPELSVLNELLGRSWPLHARATACSVFGWNESERALRQAEINQRSISAENYGRSLEALAKFDVRAEMGRVTAPVLLMRRRDSEFVSLASTEALATRLPDASIATLEGASGSIYTGDVRGHADQILDFVSENDGRPDEGIEGFCMLTNRETEILRLVTKGLRSKEIASMLGISVHTVERHIANIYGKTGTNGRAGVAVFAIRSGLV